MIGLLVALGVGAGVALRWWLLASPLGDIDRDEATVALQAAMFRDGRFDTFLWGQSYGGTLETSLVAAITGLFGMSAVAVKAAPILLHGIASVLVWRIARRVLPASSNGWIAGVVMWCGPAAFVWESTKERAFYGASLVVATTALLFVVRLADRPSRAWDAIGLGACTGLGLWTSPQVAFLAVPAAVWLVLRRPAVLRLALWAVPAAVLTATPWLAWNAGHDWASTHTPPALGTTWWQRVTDLDGQAGLLLGTTTPYAPGRRLFGLSPSAAALVLVAVVLVATLRTWRPAPGLLPVLLLGYAAVSSLNGLAAGVGYDPRYLYLAAPIVAIAIAGLLPGHLSAGVTSALAGATVVAVCALSIWGLIGLRDHAALPNADLFVASPGIEEVSRLLTERRVGTVFTDSAGTQITLATGGKVVASTFTNPRWLPFEQAPRFDPTSTYVLDRFDPAHRNPGRLQLWLATSGVRYERIVVGRWAVFFLAERVTPVQARLATYGGMAVDETSGSPSGP